FIYDPTEAGGRPLFRFGIGAIKNAGDSALAMMLDDREENGRFKSIQDLTERVDMRKVGKRTIEYAIKAGAFREYGTVPQLMDAIDRIVNYSGSQHDAASAGQMSLFGGALAPVQMSVDLVMAESDLKKEYREADYREVLNWEKEALGVYVSEHPLERPLAQLTGQVNLTLKDIDVQHNGKQLKVAGMVSSLRPLTTKKGDPMAFGKLEDLDGDIELVFFPRTWEAHRHEVQVDQVMLVYGKGQIDEGRRSILVDRVQTTFQRSMSADGPSVSADESIPTAPPQSQTSLNIEVKERSFVEPQVPSNEPPPWDDDVESDDSDKFEAESVKEEVRELPDSAQRIDFSQRESVPVSEGLQASGQLPVPDPTALDSDQSVKQQSPAASTVSQQAQQPQNGQQTTDNGQRAMEEPPLHTSDLPLNTPEEPEWDDGYFDPGPPPEAPPPPPSFGEYPAEPQLFEAPPAQKPESNQTIGEDKPIYGRTVEPEAPAAVTVISVSISSTSNWMEIIRRAVEVASRFNGKDCLVIEIVDKNQTIDFPNCKTRASEDMLELLRNISGIIEINLLEQMPA
ncbi:MAG: OB-fold nucleic acid binding domain-containing protein, partial [Chloroflexota bacterium]